MSKATVTIDRSSPFERVSLCDTEEGCTYYQIEQLENLGNWQSVGEPSKGDGSARRALVSKLPRASSHVFYRYLRTPTWPPETIDLKFIRKVGGYIGSEENLELKVENGQTYHYTTAAETNGGRTYDATMKARVSLNPTYQKPNEKFFEISVESYTFRSPVQATYALEEFRQVSGRIETERYRVTFQYTGPNSGTYEQEVYLLDGRRVQHELGKIKEVLR